MSIPVFDETPEFDKAVATAAAEAAWLKKEFESLSVSGKAVAKSLASRVELQRGLLGFSRKTEDPPVDLFFSEALSHFGDDSELSAALTASVGIKALTPVLDVLKALGGLRVKLGNKVFNSMHKPLEAFIDTEIAAVSSERERYAKAKSACDSARAEYLGLKKSADAETRSKVMKTYEDARVALRQARGRLAEAVAVLETKRQTVVLESVHESMLAYHEFVVAAAAAAECLPAQLAVLQQQTATLKAGAEARRQESKVQVERYLAVQDKVDDVDTERGPTGQNLGRSHDADIRRALEAGAGAVIKQGFLMKQARTWGWRRRFFVLDSNGMLTYYNEKAAVKETERRLTGRGGSAAALPGSSAPATPAESAAAEPPATPAPAAPPAPAASSPPAPGAAAAAPAGDAGKGPGGGGFGSRALNFMKKQAEAVQTRVETVAVAAASVAKLAPTTPGGDKGGDDDEEAKFQTVNLRLSIVKLDGDSNDRSARDLRFCFRLISPNATMTLQAESAADRDAWVSSLQGVIAELITLGPRKTMGAGSAATIETVQHGAPGNSACADCGTLEPDWASLNIGVVICQQCAGSHRSLGTHVSKVRSVALDADSWLPPVLALFAVGNTAANAAWEGARRAGGEAAPLVPEGAGMEERLALIRSKYADRAFMEPQLRETAAQPGALSAAAAAGDLKQVLALLAGGASVAAAAEGGLLPIHAAAKLGDAGAPIVAALLWNGADAAAADAAGASVLDLGRSAGAADDGPLTTLVMNSLAKRQ